LFDDLRAGVGLFEQLDRFREMCFSSFAIEHRRVLTLTDILKLYVAVYQRKEIWKICWRQIFAHLNAQCTRDVEAFVQNTPFNWEVFVKILKA
jgi:hypothetical protein